MAESKEQKRVFGLDAVRAIAVCSVIIAHSSEFLLRLKPYPVWGKWITDAVYAVQPLGYTGVEMFFALSGFLIGGIIIRDIDSGTHLQPGWLMHFWQRRWLRTLPAYWVVLTLTAVLYYALRLQGLEAYKLLYYPFWQNLYTPHPPYFFGEAWSLSVEEWFYLSFPAVLWWAARRWNHVNPHTIIMRIVGFYGLLFLLIRVVYATHPYCQEQDAGIRKIVVFRLDALVYGVAMAYAHHYYATWLSYKRYILLAIGMAGIVFAYYLLLHPEIACTAPLGTPARCCGDVGLFVLMPLSFALCLPFCYGLPVPEWRWLYRSVTGMARIAYSLYLVHYSFLFIPFFYRLELLHPVLTLPCYALYWYITVALAKMLYRLIELPFMNRRR
ncbi:MAG: acyltransferase [Chitinophagia bacterium]|nr:acyltransferase [Chitinophagia bacterium]